MGYLFERINYNTESIEKIGRYMKASASETPVAITRYTVNTEILLAYIIMLSYNIEESEFTIYTQVLPNTDDKYTAIEHNFIVTNNVEELQTIYDKMVKKVEHHIIDTTPEERNNE